MEVEVVETFSLDVLSMASSSVVLVAGWLTVVVVTTSFPVSENPEPPCLKNVTVAVEGMDRAARMAGSGLILGICRH